MYDTAAIACVDDDSVSVRTLTVRSNCRRIALIGGFTPRRCGIATFTADTYASLKAKSPDTFVDVYAMVAAADVLVSDDAVRTTIVENDAVSFQTAARAINESRADIVWLQHEFGLFGGIAGEMVFELIDRVSAPLAVTMHTVLPDPDADKLHVMHRLIARASRLVVMSEHSRRLLQTVYGADERQIVVISHGVPDRPFGRTARFKAKFGFSDKMVMTTFGLLSPGKGIETAIAALPAIITAHPNLIYCIVGATHPNLVAREGEAYRDRLYAQAEALGVADHVHWIDRFVETPQLLDLLEATDIYVTPYPGAGQSTSGTLSYALALGKAIVSTPYIHARELLADDHGVLVPFQDSAAIGASINALLDDPDRLQQLQSRAYRRGRDMLWPLFAARCLEVVEDTVVAPVAPLNKAVDGIDGLLRICDDTGILQHSIHAVPDRAHGYCVDDNARALMLMNRLDRAIFDAHPRLATTFAAFVESAWNEDSKSFRNFMDFRRNWLEQVGSEDSCGRAIWALGATTTEAQTRGLRSWAEGLFDKSAPSALLFQSPRATAFAMLGAAYRLQATPSHQIAHDILSAGANRLLTLFRQVSSDDWHWFEDGLAYDNCRLSEAMIRAGLHFDRAEWTECGLVSLRWIMAQQTAPAGHFRPVGSDSFGASRSAPMPFDQQPVEIWAAIDGAAAAFDATGDETWITHANRAFDWFYGRNDRGVCVGDPVTGTCHDGINPRGLNLNEGAESVLAYQLSACAMRRLSARPAR